MATKTTAPLALFLSLNLLFFSSTTARCGGSCPTPTPTPGRPTPTPGRPTPTPGTPTPTPGTPTPTPTTPTPSPGSSTGSCPRDALKLALCVNVLGLINATVGTPPVTPCCSLIQGLVDLEAAVCLCTVIRANILGLNLNLPIALSLVLNNCGRNVPSGFICA